MIPEQGAGHACQQQKHRGHAPKGKYHWILVLLKNAIGAAVGILVFNKYLAFLVFYKVFFVFRGEVLPCFFMDESGQYIIGHFIIDAAEDQFIYDLCPEFIFLAHCF